MEAQYEEVPVGVHSLSHFLAVVSARPSTIPLPQEKVITANVSEMTYSEFEKYAEQQDRKTAELICEAMEFYRETKIQDSGKLGASSSLRRYRSG